MAVSGDMVVFALTGSQELGQAICQHLELPLGRHEERNFEDGEHKSRPLESVRGKDVFVICSTYGDPRVSVNDKLCRLIFFLGALRDASADRVTAVIPYLCYARKDRRTKPRDPITTRYVAAMLEAIGVDRVVTMDVHNLAAFQNAFRIPTDHLEARRLIVDDLAPLVAAADVVVVSPDAGGVKRAEQFCQSLGQRLARQVPLVFMEKVRSEGVVSGEAVIGDVAGKSAIIIDDLVSTGTTLARAAAACRARGAMVVYAAATHGLFVGHASAALAHPAVRRLVVTNTVPPFRLDPAIARDKLMVLDVAPMLADAIRRIHTGGSLIELFEG